MRAEPPDRPVARLLLTAAWVGVSVAAVFMAAFLLASRLSLGRDLPAAAENVRKAYAAGDLAENTYPDGNAIRGNHQHNDCLILGMALDQPASLERRLTISPLLPGEQPCRALHDLVDGTLLEAPVVYYHRYIHGQTILARYLLPLLGVQQIRMLYKNMLSALLVAGLALSLFRFVQTRGVTFLGFGIAFAGFARFYGIELYGQSLGHGPSDSVIVIYLLFLCLVAGRHRGDFHLVLAAAVFGAFTMGFELLTGGLPLGLAMVIGGSAMACRVDAAARDVRFAAFGAALSFVIAAACCMVLKLLACVAVFGSGVLVDYAQKLAFRLAIVSDASDEVSGDNGATQLVHSLAGGLDSLTAYTRVLASGTLALAVVCGAWGFRAVWHHAPSPAWRTRHAVLAASNAVVLLWFAAFRQHTIEHAWFMDRILVWPIVTGFWLFAAGVAATPPLRSAP